MPKRLIGIHRLFGPFIGGRPEVPSVWGYLYYIFIIVILSRINDSCHTGITKTTAYPLYACRTVVEQKFRSQNENASGKSEKEY
jgi:hypothetical protein